MGRGMRALASVVLTAAAGLASAPAAAAELFGIQVEIHGAYELQLRSIARDFNFSDNMDVTQFYHVLGLETEIDFAPDGLGPIDVLQGFLRLEVRYDCVWTRGCGIFSSMDAFGNRAKKLPGRVNDGRRNGFRSTGVIFNGDTRAFADIPRAQLPYQFRFRPDGDRSPGEFFNIYGIDTLFDSPGADGIFGNADDPAPFYFDRALDECDFAFRKTRGSEGGVGVQNMVWNPGCDIRPIGAMRGKPNPVRADDLNPITGRGGAGALPLRPAPTIGAGAPQPDLASAGRLLPERAARRDAAKRRVRRLRPELHGGGPRLEPRREPAGREGAEGGLPRHRALRQPALAPPRQADGRLGQDGALPQPGPLEPPGPGARLAARARGVAHRALDGPRRLAVLERRVRSRTCARSSC